MFILLSFITFILPIGAVAFLGYLGLRFVRAREREGPAGLADAERRNLTRLEEQVQALQSEVETLRDRQDFTERLLERPRETGRPGT